MLTHFRYNTSLTAMSIVISATLS